MPEQPALWLRAESKAGEARTALVPADAAALVAAGFDISVERSKQRCFIDSEFIAAGCSLAEPGSWPEAPRKTFILGLKELPEDHSPLPHQHIYFAHAYKGQQGWQQLLGRFGQAGGSLLDLEYLVDDNKRRLAAFGYWAGFVGAALGVLAWCARQHGEEPVLPQLSPWPDKVALHQQCEAALAGLDKPSTLIIGALGRVGSGASDLADKLGLPVSPWDLAETSRGGPFPEILEHDLFVNCVLVNEPLPPFIETGILTGEARRLQIIADISCDPYGDYNPIPLYSRCSSTSEPTLRIAGGDNPLDLIAIDNLPSLLPRESSEDFSSQLLPVLKTLGDNEPPVWKRAKALFQDHLKKLG